MPTLDLAIPRLFLQAHPPKGEVVLCAITGSHQCGFSSADSDLDIKGIHLAPTRSVLGLDPPSKAHNRLEVFEGVECDLTTNEAAAAIKMLLGGNGNVLERIFSPLQLFETEELEQWRELARGAASQRAYNHYRGFLRGMMREHDREDPPRAKSLLYTFRIALTGTHYLRTGEVEAHLPTLADEYGVADLTALLESKYHGTEKGPLPAELAAHYRSHWPDLDVLIDDALAASPLPEEPANRAECEEWLIQRRIREIR